LVIDMLNPMDLGNSLDPGKNGGWLDHPERFAAEWPRYKESGINIFHTGLGIGGADAYTAVLRNVAQWNGLIAHNTDQFLRVDSPERLADLKGSWKIGVVLGIQDSDHFRSPKDVDEFYGLGQRVSQLTYNSRNLIGDGSTERTDVGLSELGVNIVTRMN